MTEDWTPIADLDPESDDFPARVEIAGDRAVVFRQGDRYWGVQRFCPHQHTDFSRGVLMGNGTMIRCGLHAYTFKLKDGSGVNCPGYRIDVYEVVRDNGRLMGRKVERAGPA